MTVLFRLALWQLKNTLRDALTNPRKLVPLALAAVVVVWFLYIVMHPQPGAATPLRLFDTLPAHRSEVHAVTFLLLSLFMAALLDRGFVGGTLAYSASDTDYLFLAPISSRLVLGFKLLRPAPGILLAILYNVFCPRLD